MENSWFLRAAFLFGCSAGDSGTAAIARACTVASGCVSPRTRSEPSQNAIGVRPKASDEGRSPEIDRNLLGVTRDRAPVHDLDVPAQQPGNRRVVSISAASSSMSRKGLLNYGIHFSPSAGGRTIVSDREYSNRRSPLQCRRDARWFASLAHLLGRTLLEAASKAIAAAGAASDLDAPFGSLGP
jgi:hypothetical protein